MPGSDYVMQDTPKSRCKKGCGPVQLLCPKNGDTTLPWFYICFTCRVVSQVGKGQVCGEE